MRKIAVTNDLLHQLRPALWGAKATIRNELARGASSLFQTSGKNLIAVIRFERQAMVVVAVVGRNLNASVDEFISLARQHMCTSIRFHTKNPQHLEKGLGNLPLKLIEVRNNLFSKPELVYMLRL